MDIKQENHHTHGRFYYVEDGKTFGEMFYRWQDDNTMAIHHTEVAASMQGKGVGKAMLDFAVRKSRDEGYRIVALCPFVKRMFQHAPEKYQDVCTA